MDATIHLKPPLAAMQVGRVKVSEHSKPGGVRYVLDRLAHDIRMFGDGVIGRVIQLVQFVALVLLTLWVMVQGYRVLTGQMREPLMQMMTSPSPARSFRPRSRLGIST
ncbi:hypothetical protein [Marilutibacter alkalisoli]|uniref:Uncharacterized protein n=1 Tax=Marilutibacter alkalisoli TaxID=2591633 RepID=A0A514BVA9_9GAMM|nr:hypothetical protein [Lysobacter alkalisoli]QDH71341.1 hypothetical protein FKV23_15525 [Lysobacter alkalisoli]